MEHDHPPQKKIIPHSLSILILITTCILANTVAILYEFGALHIWKSLPRLSSPAIQIFEADPDNVWIKAADGNIYTASLYCSSDTPCHEWSVVNDVSAIQPFDVIKPKRASNCELIDKKAPRNPSDTVIECVRTFHPSFGEGGSFTSYFALLSDGRVKYWQHFDGFFPFTQICFGIIATIFCPSVALWIATVLYSKVRAKAG